MSEIKIAAVGAGAVGKSSLVIRYVSNQFVDYYDPTIEDSYRKEETINKESFILDILDTAGQEDYHMLRDIYMRKREGFCLVYSITDRKSFEEVTNLVNQIKRVKEDRDDIPMVLIGNKCDCESERQITKSQGISLAEDLNIPFMETSAKSGQNCKEIFHELIRMVNEFQKKEQAKKEKQQKRRNSGKKKVKCTIL
ncbi:hypothetical protein ABK040_000601 [Willaertia magna]